MLILPTLLKGIGAGLSLFGGIGAARAGKINAATNSMIAIGNAEVQRGNDLAALSIDSMRSQSALDTARLQSELALSDADARERNAERLRQYAGARTGQSREAIRRQMRAFDEFQSSQKTTAASAGVLQSGSVMDVMAESISQMALTIQDMHNEANFERNDSLDRATMESFAASQGRVSANAGLLSAERGFRINQASNQLGQLAAQGNYRSAIFGAQIGRLNGQQAAQGQFLNTVANTLSFFSTR